jgi:hypothetical protein
MTHAQRAGRSLCSSLALPGRLKYGKNFALYLLKRMKVSSASVGEMSSDWRWVDDLSVVFQDCCTPETSNIWQ